MRTFIKKTIDRLCPGERANVTFCKNGMERFVIDAAVPAAVDGGYRQSVGAQGYIKPFS